MDNNEDYEDEEQSTSSSGSVLKDFYYNNKKLIIIFLVVIGVIILLSILTKSGGGSSNNDISMAIQYNGTEVKTEEVSVGYSIKLNAMLSNGSSANNVTWTSSDSSVATVTGGLVTGVSLGRTIITANYQNNGKPVSSTCEITVYDGSPNISLTSVGFPEGDILMGVGTKYSLSLTLEP